MILLLARHGNTFAPGEPAVWVGRRNDLPLVESGRRQAEALAACLKRAGCIPAVVRTGPLARTREFGAIIAAELGVTAAPSIDVRLDELDYGGWSGLTNDEVAARYGAEAIERWEREGRWPTDAGWESDAETISREVRSLMDEVRASAHSPQLLVSSNGRLRFFLDAAGGSTPSGSRKTATGRLGIMRLDASEAPRILGWNLSPEDALPALESAMVR